MISDSQSTTSSIENRSPVNRKKRRDLEGYRRLGQRIEQQKQAIIKGLDSGYPKAHLDAQIAVSVSNVVLCYLRETFTDFTRLSKAVYII